MAMIGPCLLIWERNDPKQAQNLVAVMPTQKDDDCAICGGKALNGNDRNLFGDMGKE